MGDSGKKGFAGFNKIRSKLVFANVLIFFRKDINIREIKSNL